MSRCPGVLSLLADALDAGTRPAASIGGLSVLRGLLRLVADEERGYLEQAPEVRLEREPQGRRRFLTDDEAPRLLRECRKTAEHEAVSCRNPYLYPVVVVALNTGMRKSEVLGLEWDRVNFSCGVLQFEKTKNGSRREVPMNQAVYDVLSALPKEHLDQQDYTTFYSAPAAPRSLGFG
jgi:integrase